MAVRASVETVPAVLDAAARGSGPGRAWWLALPRRVDVPSLHTSERTAETTLRIRSVRFVDPADSSVTRWLGLGDSPEGGVGIATARSHHALRLHHRG
jgi:hypothetical protein